MLATFDGVPVSESFAAYAEALDAATRDLSAAETRKAFATLAIREGAVVAALTDLNERVSHGLERRWHLLLWVLAAVEAVAIAFCVWSEHGPALKEALRGTLGRGPLWRRRAPY